MSEQVIVYSKHRVETEQDFEAACEELHHIAVLWQKHEDERKEMKEDVLSQGRKVDKKSKAIQKPLKDREAWLKDLIREYVESGQVRYLEEKTSEAPLEMKGELVRAAIRMYPKPYNPHVTFKDKVEVEIVNPDAVPDRYKKVVIDERKILEDYQRGETIPGVQGRHGITVAVSRHEGMAKSWPLDPRDPSRT